MKDAKVEKHQVDEIVLVGGSTRVPKIRELVKTYFGGKEANSNVNPDEAVAYGATVQAAILAGEVEDDCDIVLIDVTPLSLGTDIQGGLMHVMIPKNTQIPTNCEQTFTSVVDNQHSLKFEIYEGERKFFKDNHMLGRFDLVDLPQRPAGQLNVKCIFDIDSNGILNVRAFDKDNEEN